MLSNGISGTSQTKAATELAVKDAKEAVQTNLNSHATNKLNPHEVTTKQVNMIGANSKTNSDLATSYPEGITVMQVSVVANGFPSQYGVLTTTRIGSFAQQEFSLAAGTFIYNRIWNPNSSVWSAWDTSETTTGAQAKATAIQDWAKGLGLGGIVKNVNNFDNLGLETGFYLSAEGSINTPLVEFGTVLHLVRNGNSITQTFTGAVSGRVFVRTKSTSGWSAWKELATKNDVLTGLMGGKVTDKIVENFEGKIPGSTVVNPHSHKYAYQSALQLPSSSNFGEAEAAAYTAIYSLNGVTSTRTSTVNGVMAQKTFPFNLIVAVERKVGTIPGNTTAEKVAWLRVNITKLTVNWHGIGSSPLGYKATLSIFRYDNNQWYAPSISTSATISKLTRALSSQADLNVIIDNGGFVHYLVNAEPSNGLTGSSLSTDYIDLEIELAISGPNVAIDTHVKDALIHRKISIQATAPTNPTENDIWIEV